MATATTAVSETVAPLGALSLKSDASDLARMDRQAFIDHCKAQGINPLWSEAIKPAPLYAHTDMVPQIWRYKDLRPLLEHACNVTTTLEAERRALIFINSGKAQTPYTLDTILAALQILRPGEKALCHRHTVFAIRFMIEGDQTYTAVGGVKMFMEKNDLVLTTRYQFHDHGNDGEETAIWLDGLDLPMFEETFAGTSFMDRYHERSDTDGARYHPSEIAVGDKAPAHYSWVEMHARLDAVDGPYALLEYHNEAIAHRHISTTLAAYAERIDEGAQSFRAKDTANRIFHCAIGSGYTVISLPGPGFHGSGGQQKTIRWTESDTFVVPSWHEFQHFADVNSYLFHYSDRSAQDQLGLFMDANSPRYLSKDAAA